MCLSTVINKKILCRTGRVQTCSGRCCWRHRGWWGASWSSQPCAGASKSCWPGCEAAGRTRPPSPTCWRPPGSSSSCSPRAVSGCSPGWWSSTSSGRSIPVRSSAPGIETPFLGQFLRTWEWLWRWRRGLLPFWFSWFRNRRQTGRRRGWRGSSRYPWAARRSARAAVRRQSDRTYFASSHLLFQNMNTATESAA